MEVDTSDQTPAEPPPPLSNEELSMQRREKLLERKQTIACLASAVMQNPEDNMKKLKELRLMLHEEDSDVFITVRKLAMVSMMELFKDIIPGYRIRPHMDVKLVKLKQETRSLQDYETSLLNNYRLYLEYLESVAKGGKGQVKGRQKHGRKRENGASVDMTEDTSKAMSEIAVQCLCQMLVNHPHFNYRNNIIAVLIPLMCKKSDQIVRLISRLLKNRDNNVDRKVLDTFLSLRIKEVFKGEDDTQKKLMRKEKMLKWSRRERKRQKQMEKLEKELLETKATENKKAQLKLHTEVIQAVFLTYFRILKSEKKPPLLPSVLEGLAKFSHLINVEFFDDLFEVLNQLIDSERLSYRETLHCVLTAFTILTGQGSALNIDPIRFYKHLYGVLLKVHAGSSIEDIALILDCLDVVVSRRKRQISEHRILAYIKRLCTLCLQLLPHGSIATLAMCKTLIQTYSRSDLLYDNEMQGSGVYLPELDDPEHCHAQNTALWELNMLTKHYHPTVRKYSSHVVRQAPTTGEGQLTVELTRKTHRELLKEFNLGPVEVATSLPEKVKQSKKAVKLKGWQQEDLGMMMESVLTTTPDSLNTGNT
ncbi:nucleolar complex protein 3 homolog isoform X2 [Liolophura sinensis]|uniref:nucleolar complex protein 3 homolog isoform X2 n=1 Tax=Liolophura sinensis TaxID=3198878 RepID=UPI003158B50D